MTIYYTVAANTGAARSTTVEIADLSYTVNQQKATVNSGKKR